MKSIQNYTRKEQAYEAPAVKSLDILSEGVLCASTDTFSIKAWETDSESLDFV